MATLNETPSGNRVHVAFFGLRNVGKSTLVNAFTGQSLAIVSATPGTTTDPVSKAMEILPLGPCLITDTAGLDDEGELGEMRVRKTLDVLATTDVAIWVDAGADSDSKWHDAFLSECGRRDVVVIEYRRGEDVGELRRRIAAVKLTDEAPGLLDGLVGPGARVICVCPIDESAPKGRLILPQVQVIRACLDLHVACSVVQVAELRTEISRLSEAGRLLVITDSQAFKEVGAIVAAAGLSPEALSLTSFSILFARQKGDLEAFRQGLAAITALKDGDTVLIAEGCTHHRQCNDIGSIKIPKALAKLSGRRLDVVFASGKAFSLSVRPALIVHCGGCMLTRREVLRRIGLARAAGIPIVNYGLLLAAANQAVPSDVFSRAAAS